jgi:hypothetical protein
VHRAFFLVDALPGVSLENFYSFTSPLRVWGGDVSTFQIIRKSYTSLTLQTLIQYRFSILKKKFWQII